MVDLKDKVCVVTGGGRGLGKAMVKTFADANAATVWALDLGFTEFTDLETYSNIRTGIMDVTSPQSIAEMVSEIIKTSGRIDVLVNNAGITRDGLIHKMDNAMWEAVIKVNLDGVFYMTREVAPHMQEQQSGVIISMASVVGIDGNIGQSNYAATKGAVISMTKTWAKELSRKGEKIRVNAIAPGFIRTPMTETVPEKVLDGIVAKTPLKRMGEAQDVANAALFLASDLSEFITGQVLRVDGGLVF